jgi:CheY-like chemotaxis protein
MAVITIDSGLYCHGPEVATAVADRLGFARLMDEQLFAAASERFGVSTKKLERALYGSKSLFSSVLRDREKGTAYLRAAISELIEPDDTVYCGLVGHLLPRALNNVLKVCLAGTAAYRLAEAERQGVSPRTAARQVERDDEVRAEWTKYLFDLGPWDKSLYDIFLPMQDSTVEEAVELISENALRPVLSSSPHTVAALRDFQLAARVGVALAEGGHDVDVECTDGRATILIKNRTLFLERLENELAELALKVPGVRDAAARPGPRYREPNIYINLDVDVPSKVLLVDDEREFVHTLSERLQTRSMEPAIAYDGEQALEMIANDEPEVMVLDLKMPGIDGIEVLRRVKQSHPATEVIILTGHGSEAEQRLAAELGAFAYLRKPVDIEVLTQTMKEAYRKVNEAKTERESS